VRKEFQPRYTKQQYCSQRCGTRRSVLRTPEPEARRVERPDDARLLKELAETNDSTVGREDGVSDDAIRKWVRAHE
jgi:hypothetical protein